MHPDGERCRDFGQEALPLPIVSLRGAGPPPPPRPPPTCHLMAGFLHPAWRRGAQVGDSRLQPGIMMEGRGRRFLNGHCHRFPFTCSHSCFFLRFTDLLSVNPWNTLARGISGLTASRGIRGEVKLCVGPVQDWPGRPELSYQWGHHIVPASGADGRCGTHHRPRCESMFILTALVSLWLSSPVLVSPGEYNNHPWATPWFSPNSSINPCRAPHSRLLLISCPYWNALPLPSDGAVLHCHRPVTWVCFIRPLHSLEVGRGTKKSYALYMLCEIFIYDISLSPFDHPGRQGMLAPYSRKSSERSRNLLKIS